MQKMGWKRGEGLGKNASGVRNPITPNLKYDRIGGQRPGLGFQKPVDEGAPGKATKEGADSLPKIDPHRVKIFQNRSNREMAEQRAFALGLTGTYKLNSLDMKVGAQENMKNSGLSKFQLKKCQEHFDEILQGSIRAKEALIRVGLHIHEEAKSEIVGAHLDLYKQEAARLWSAAAKIINRDCPWDLYLDFIIRVREVFLEEDLKEHSIMEIDDSDDDIIVVGSSTASVPAKRKAPSNDRPKNPKVKVITRRISAPKSSKNDVILLD